VHPDDPRTVVRDRVLAVIPVDDREAADQAAILEWIDSGAPLFRTVPPATPPKHLAVYFALVDDDARCVLLVDHRRRPELALTLPAVRGRRRQQVNFASHVNSDRATRALFTFEAKFTRCAESTRSLSGPAGPP
jgi:hypothetical protein